MPVKINPCGHDTLFVQRAKASKLARLLRPSVPLVWILGHTPNPYLQWWDAEVPLNVTDQIAGRIRMLAYDMQLPTTQFLERAAAFDGHGLTLVQAHRPMPDTLDLFRVPEEHQDRVLLANGAFLKIWLPHASETACVVCYESGHLASVHG